MVEGTRQSVTGSNGVRIGLLTAGTGPRLLLVHGGMGQIERWEPVWDLLTSRWQVTALDRRGRATSGDREPYSIEEEYDDVAAVAKALAEDAGGPIDVFAHSYGATCTLGAAAGSAPFRRMVLYEPPGPQTVPQDWVDRITKMVADGQAGRAMFSFLTEIVGLTVEQVEALRDAPGGRDILPVVSAIMPREAQALSRADLLSRAPAIRLPVMLLQGSESPRWARDITRILEAALPLAELVVLPGQGHEAIDAAPDMIVSELEDFLLDAA